jgi:hypothetical protein
MNLKNNRQEITVTVEKKLVYPVYLGVSKHITGELQNMVSDNLRDWTWFMKNFVIEKVQSYEIKKRTYN